MIGDIQERSPAEETTREEPTEEANANSDPTADSASAPIPETPQAPTAPSERAAKAAARIRWRWEQIENFYQQSSTAVHNYLVDLKKIDLFTQRDEFLKMEQEMLVGSINAQATIQKMHAGLMDAPLEAPSKLIVPDKRIILPGQQ